MKPTSKIYPLANELGLRHLKIEQIIEKKVQIRNKVCAKVCGILSRNNCSIILNVQDVRNAVGVFTQYAVHFYIGCINILPDINHER